MIEAHLDLYAIFVWILVGLVAGFVASRVMLGHGLGLVGDIVTGIVGAILAAFLSGLAGLQISITGHPILTQIFIAFLGAVILLAIIRLVELGRGRPR